MQQPIGQFLAICLVGALAIVTSSCSEQVRADEQRTSAFELDRPHPDLKVQDCEHLTQASMPVEVDALGVRLAIERPSGALTQNLQDLKQSLEQLQTLPLQTAQVIQLRDQYISLQQASLQALQPVTQPPSAIPVTVKQTVLSKLQAAGDLRRNQIFFGSCQPQA
jgi:hypothetical protein